MIEVPQQEGYISYILNKLKNLSNFVLKLIHRVTWGLMGEEVEQSVYVSLSPVGIKFYLQKGHKRAEAFITITNFSPYPIKIDKISMKITSIETRWNDFREKEGLYLELSCNDKNKIEPRTKGYCTLKTDLESQSEKFEKFKSGYVECHYSGPRSWFIYEYWFSTKDFHIPSSGGNTFTVAEIHNELYTHHSNQSSKESD